MNDENGDEFQVLTCMACGFTSTMGEMITAHQSICEGIEPEKREFRRAILAMQFGEELIPRLQELAQSQARNQGV